jgi:general stress protein YciG
MMAQRSQDREQDQGKGEQEKETMTVQEAGRMGGETVRDKYGPEFYSEIGHKGGQRVKELIEEGKEAEEQGGEGKR